MSFFGGLAVMAARPRGLDVIVVRLVTPRHENLPLGKCRVVVALLMMALLVMALVMMALLVIASW